MAVDFAQKLQPFHKDHTKDPAYTTLHIKGENGGLQIWDPTSWNSQIEQRLDAATAEGTDREPMQAAIQRLGSL